MAAIETDIQAVLAALVADRCYPLLAPVGVEKPYIVYQVISNTPTVTLDGATGTEDRRVQIDGYATNYAGMKALEESIKTAMADAAFINIPLLTSDLYESETKLYRILMDYTVWN